MGHNSRARRAVSEVRLPCAPIRVQPRHCLTVQSGCRHHAKGRYRHWLKHMRTCSCTIRMHQRARWTWWCVVRWCCLRLWHMRWHHDRKGVVW